MSHEYSTVDLTLYERIKTQIDSTVRIEVRNGGLGLYFYSNHENFLKVNKWVYENPDSSAISVVRGFIDPMWLNPEEVIFPVAVHFKKFKGYGGLINV